MPVEIEESEHFDDIDVTLICEGCGEVIEEYTAFEDRKEEIKDMKPIHDSVKCRRKAVEKGEASGDTL